MFTQLSARRTKGVAFTRQRVMRVPRPVALTYQRTARVAQFVAIATYAITVTPNPLMLGRRSLTHLLPHIHIRSHFCVRAGVGSGRVGERRLVSCG